MAAEGILKALRHVWFTLRSLHVPAAVMGGMGMAAWKHVRANRESLDLGYLRQWAKDLDVLSGLAEAWNEAFLGEPLPSD